ncbi:MAG TPA: polyprenol monophosphomannose synthase [bacterium]|nr:polyprenol monophosphomannose synthase [bacterium]HPN43674.1 polyprenol monophosphomannose synthase [bacterium]
MKILVIIPTYNERQNIEKLLEKITSQNIAGLDILVIDDNSPDGTGECVTALAQSNPRLYVLRREGKQGLGTAYVAGFRYALQHGYDLIIEMDADFSHDPNELKNLIAGTDRFDLVIGSRYINGVNVINWPLSRLMLSMGASLYTRLITGLPLHDCTSGFKCFKRQVLEAIDLDSIQSDGYSFQIEMHFKAWKKGFKLGEIPIIFYDRTAGTSKMSKKIVREAIWVVWQLKLASLTGRLK